MYYAKWSITYTGAQKLLIKLIIDSRIRVIKRYDIHTQLVETFSEEKSLSCCTFAFSRYLSNQDPKAH